MKKKILAYITGASLQGLAYKFCWLNMKSKNSIPYLLVLVFIVYSIIHTHAQTYQTFHVGNSLTDQAYGMHDVARAKGIDSKYGRHMIAGAPLSWLWDHKCEGNISPSGYTCADQVLKSLSWNFLILQPYDRDITSDVTYSTNYMQSAYQGNSNCVTYIFAHWPKKSQDYNTVWIGPNTDSRSRGHFEGVCNGLRNGFPDKQIYIIPVGEVMYELNKKAKAGQLPGVTDIDQLYEDEVHLNDKGKYIEIITHFATVFKTDPHGAIISGLTFWKGPYAVPQDFAKVVWDVAWNVVTTYPYTGVQVSGNQNPIASFTLSPQSGMAPLTVSFDASASYDPDGSISSFAWDFGDNSSGTGVTTSHTYMTPGTYNIKLTVTDNKGATSSKQFSLLVSNANSTNTIEAKKSISTIVVDGNLTELQWNPGIPDNEMNKNLKGTPDNKATFKVVWDDQNLYIAARVVDGSLHHDSNNPWDDDAIEIFIDGNNNKASVYDQYDRQYVFAHEKALWVSNGKTTSAKAGWANTTSGYTFEAAIPWSDFGVSPSVDGIIGFDIGCDDDDDGGGLESQLIWQGTSQNWSNTSAFGNVKLTNKTAGNTKPVAVISATPLYGNTPLEIQFNGSKSYDNDLGDQVYGYEWDFGDGSPKEQSTAPTHTFSSPGTYTVTLVVLDYNYLQSDPVKTTIIVTQKGGGSCASGDASFVLSSGRVVMEAENFNDSKKQNDQVQWQTGSTQPGYSGSGYVYVGDGSTNNIGTAHDNARLSYRIEFTNSGTYTLWVRRWSPDGSGNSVFATLGGVQSSSYDNLPDDKIWVWKSLGTATIPVSGVYILELIRREDGYLADKIMINSGETPTGNGPTETTCISTGFGKDDPEMLVMVYPNPANENVILEINKPSNRTATIELINYLGQTVKRLQYREWNSSISIPVNDLQSGIYSFKISVENKTVLRRIVISK